MVRESRRAGIAPAKARDRILAPAALPLVASGLLILVLTAGLRAQDPGPPARTPELPKLASYAPEETAVFIEVDSLSEIQSQFGNDYAWGLLASAVGAAGGVGWSRALEAALGAEFPTLIRPLFDARVALSARSRDDFSDGVLLFSRPPSMSENAVMGLFVGPGRWRTASKVGNVRICEAPQGLWIASNGDTLALSQVSGPGTLLDRTIALLSGESRSSLAATPAFRNTVGALPTPRAGCAFWRAAAPAATSQPAATQPADSKPAMSVGALGAYVSRNGLHVVLRAQLEGSREVVYRPRVALEPLWTLPRSTLAAWATSLDMPTAFAEARRSASASPLAGLWQTIETDAEASRNLETAVANVGPRCVLVLGGDFTSERLTPQLAVMFESVNAELVITALRAVTERLVASLAPSSGERRPIEIALTDYLGTTIHELRVAEDMSASTGDPLAALVVRSMTPSFAMIRGWLIVSTSPDHIRQIIDANNALSPRISELEGVSQAARRFRRSVSLAMFQPALALDALRHWQAALEGEIPDHWQLGIVARTDTLPGQVVVEDVNSSGPAGGLIQAGDVVIGCNGVLLGMDSPSADLKGLLADTPHDAPVRLRLLRAGEMVEVLIEPQVTTFNPLSGPGDLPSPAAQGLRSLLSRLTPLEPLAEVLAFTIYAEARPQQGVYQGELLLRFREPPAPAPIEEPVAPPVQP